MSTAVVSTSAALGRLFVFDDEPGSAKPCHPERSRVLQSTIKNQQSTIAVVPASRLGIRPAPEMASSGIAALDALTGGLPRGCLTEICGPASSGRTTVLLAALSAATRRGEFCALLDAGDSFDPTSAAAAGVDFNRLLWVRCGEERGNSPQRHGVTEKTTEEKTFGPPRLWQGMENHSLHGVIPKPRILSSGARDFAWHCPNNDSQPAFNTKKTKSNNSEHSLEQLLRATDLLLESGGFGLIVLDLADVPQQAARRIPLTTWFRFRRAVEHKPTILLAIEERPIAGSCSSVLLQLGSQNFKKTTPEHVNSLSHAHLLTELDIHAELTQSRLERKPAQSITFATKTAWAG